MKINPLTVLALTLTLAVPSLMGRAEEPENKLVGTWKLVSAKYGGKDRKFPEGYTTIKHVTPTQFMWASYGKDGKLIRAAGGTYTIAGEAYEETPSYGFSADFSLVGGKTHKFKCRVEGNKWYHDGALSSGLTIEEVWEREEKK